MLRRNVTESYVRAHGPRAREWESAVGLKLFLVIQRIMPGHDSMLTLRSPAAALPMFVILGLRYAVIAKGMP
jgi:hypothetical protein